MAERTGDDAQSGAAAPPASYVGAVDRLVQARLSGWAVTIAGDPCQVTVKIDGAIVATVASDRPRPDLAAKQQARGLGGWQVDLAAELAAGAVRIDLVFADGTPLRGSPLDLPAATDGWIGTAPAGDPDGQAVAHAPGGAARPAKTYVGAIDTPDRDVISGWAIGSDFTPAAVLVQVNDQPPIMIAADHDRADLIAQQLTRSGGGWMFEVGPALAPGMNRISIRFPDGQPLPGSPIARLIEPGRSASAAGARAARLSNVTPFPARTPGRPAMPSLAELDELSLDALSLAVAAGLIEVEPPAARPPIAPPLATPPARPRHGQGRSPGFLARLLKR